MSTSLSHSPIHLGSGKDAFHSVPDLFPRRFRANILLETGRTQPFLEDAWVGGTLVFGDTDAPPAVTVTLCDTRCLMINLDPDTAVQDPRIMKTVVRLNQNKAGVYATVVRTGTIRVGDSVHLLLSRSSPSPHPMGRGPG